MNNYFLPFGSLRTISLILVAISIGFAVLGFAIQPAMDDWIYTRVLFSFPREHMVPTSLHWHPFDHLVFWLISYFPGLHTPVCHAFAIFGHLLALVALRRIFKDELIPLSIAFVLLLVTGLNPANAAAVWSVDSMNQTWSTAIGLLSVICARRGNLVGWIVLGFVATLWKESGLAWFVVVPILNLQRKNPRTIRQILGLVKEDRLLWYVGFFSGIAYFIIRYMLSPKFSIGEVDGRYAVSLNPFTWIRNSLMLIGIAAIPVDTVSLLGDSRSIAKGLLPAIFYAPFLFYVGRILLSGRSKNLVSMFLSFLIVSAATLPHVGIQHVSEMYAHPITFVVSIVLAIELSKSNYPFESLSVSGIKGSLILAIVALCVVNFVKFSEMYLSGRRSDHFVERHRD